MLFSLVKKDFILAKRYLLFFMAYAIGIPIIVTVEEVKISGTPIFFFTVLVLEYMMLSSVWIQEEKNKGSVLLCTTPYTRKTLVKEKYIFVLAIFILNCIIYNITALVVPIGIEKLSVSNIGVTLLIISIIFGTHLPVLYKFGFQKTRYIGVLIVFGITILPPKLNSITGWLHSKDIDISNIIPSAQVIKNTMPYILALTIGIISMYISMGIYAKKDL